MSKYSESVAHLQTLIHENGYYVSLWNRVLLSCGMTQQGIREQLYEDEHMRNALFEFWAALPDSMSIRRDPFFMLCDLCEETFDDE